MVFLPESYKNLPTRISELVLVKTNIGAYFFDAFLSVAHSSKLKITENPVESGSTVADHAYMEPRELTMEIGMSDVLTSLVPGQFNTGYTRSVSAYQTLRQMQIDRIPLFVHTRLDSYQNMLIQAISAPDDKNTQFGLRCSVTLREVIISSVKFVPVSADPQVTNSSNQGQVVPQTPQESMLFQLGLFGTGKNQVSTDYSWPVNGNFKISSGFGRRIDPVTFLPKIHNGIDIPAPKGTPVRASKSGIVTLAGPTSGYGNAVKIDHGNGYTLYGHNDSILVTVGQEVSQGQFVAKVGNTGKSTGNHLHFEINEGGTFQNPQKFFK